MGIGSPRSRTVPEIEERRLKRIGSGVESVVLVLTAAAGSLLTAGPVWGQGIPTTVKVSVIAHDGKLMGSGVGGARVTIRDLDTGEVLVDGLHQGGTGDTGKIIELPHVRGESLFDTPGAAHFSAELSLTAPTRVEIVAEGPLSTPQAMQRATKSTLLIPGEHVEGDGIVLELNGFRIEILEIEPVGGSGGDLSVRALVTMMCGCVTEPGGIWDSDRFRIWARIVRGGRVVSEAPLSFTGETSIHHGVLSPGGIEGGELQVFASDRGRGNFGMASRLLTTTR